MDGSAAASLPALVTTYEPPGIEMVMTPDELGRQVHYAGPVSAN